MGRMAEGRWRLTAHAAAALLALAALTACTPDPTPTPSPTGFASDEEAFAAAEDTYRAYIDAVNRRREDNSATDPNQFLTGEALQDSIDGTRNLEAAGFHIEGPAQITAVRHIKASDTDAVIGVCLSSVDTRVIDSGGNDVTPTDRPDTTSLEIEVTFAEPLHLIVQSVPDGGASC